MIAENVIFEKDNSGHNMYIPESKLREFYDWIDSDPDEAFEHGTYFDGETYVVNIIRKL